MPDLHSNYLNFCNFRGASPASPKYPDFVNWHQVRSLFKIDPEIVYLNSGTEGSMPKFLLNNYMRYLEKWASSPSYNFAFDEIFQDWQTTNRKKLGNFIGTTSDNICITGNTTEGLSMVAMGLNLGVGDEVISTLHDFPSSESAFNVLMKSKGVSYLQLPLPSPANSKQEIVEIFLKAITPKTKVLCFSHINYTTGLRMPVKELCNIAKEHNIISIVDGAHALGMIPLNMEEIGCDFYAAAGHKWLNGPPGTGVLYMRDAKNNPHNLLPIISELFGFETSYSIDQMLQVRGCNNTPGYTAMMDAVGLYESIGQGRIQSRILELHAYLTKRIREQWNENVLLSPSAFTSGGDLCSGIVTFVPSNDFAKRFDKKFITTVARQIIREYKIWIRDISYLDKYSDGLKSVYALRVSTGIFNNFGDIDKLIKAVVSVASI